MKKNHRQAGISLYVAMGSALLSLGVGIVALESIYRLFAQTVVTERSNQFFFASESALESALFHKNARGAGTEMNGSLNFNNINTSWELDGRRENVVGILPAQSSINIPLQWDNSSNIDNTPNTNGIVDDDFSITFYNTYPAGDPPFDPNTEKDEQYFYDRYGKINIKSNITAMGDENEDEVLIDWSLSRLHNSDGAQVLYPADSNGDPCGNTATFVCEDDFLVDAGEALDINTVGVIQPGITNSDIRAFHDNINATNFYLSARPLLDLKDVATDYQVLGIPFVMTRTGGGEIPTSTFSITTNVTSDQFSQSLTVELPEKASGQSFGYVIF